MPTYFNAGTFNYGSKGGGLADLSDTLLAAQIAQNKQDNQNQADMDRDDNRASVDAAIQEQARQNEQQRQIMGDAATYGVSPVVDQDTGKVNIYATAAATTRAKTAAVLAQQLAGKQQDYDLDLNNRAQAAGVNPNQSSPQQPFNLSSGGDTGNDAPMTPDAAPAVPLQRQVALAEQKQALDKQNASMQQASDLEVKRQQLEKNANDIRGYQSMTGQAPDVSMMNPDGSLTPQAQQTMAIAANNLALRNKVAQDAAPATSLVDAKIKAGVIDPSDRDAAIAYYQGSGGKDPALDATQKDAIATSTQTLNGLNRLKPLVTGAESAYGVAPGGDPNDAFGKKAYLAQAAGSLTDANKYANSIRAVNQGLASATTDLAVAKGGTRGLSPAEIANFQSQVGSPTSGDFATRNAQYTNSVSQTAAQQLQALQNSPARWTPEGQNYIQQLQTALGSGAAAQPAQPFQILSIKRVK